MFILDKMFYFLHKILPMRVSKKLVLFCQVWLTKCSKKKKVDLYRRKNDWLVKKGDAESISLNGYVLIIPVVFSSICGQASGT